MTDGAPPHDEERGRSADGAAGPDAPPLTWYDAFLGECSRLNPALSATCN